MRLQLRGITKRFPGVVANDGVDLDVAPGEIHALLGENGAGKTTLVNILYGLYHADEGEIRIDDEPVTFPTPGAAIAAGIGMVHQHFMLVPVFTVTENVMLGVEDTGPLTLLNRDEARRKVEDIATRYGLHVNPDAVIEELPVGVQQRVEIIKALYRQADVLILDEPTAVLTPQETEELFGVMRSLRSAGKSIIFITHKLKEVLAVADRITVLRGGTVVGTTTPKETSEQGLASMMVGREVILEVEKERVEPGEPILDIEGLTVLDDRGQVAVDDVSLQVRRWEVVGVAGVQGNGQTELVEALTGLRPVAAGRVVIGGKDLTGASPRQVFESGVAHVPEDRIHDGLVGDFTVADNLVLNTYYLAPFARGPVRNDKVVARTAEDLSNRFDIRTPSILASVGNLSGGNQQKVIVAREFSRTIALLIASQPTRGLDVGSIEYIHRRIIERRDEGVGVLLVSPELDEVLSLSDRIAVMYRGRIVAVLDAGEVTREQLGLLMAGATVDGANEESA
ncbi:MAG TPA: ABC transporter ATP-binding protein [Actinomycetota bacterium]|jgi:simple sugar transport system ATP-binding protein|nr:ABC transporter ATP-binding protein [Actinomycetota bacterium]